MKNFVLCASALLTSAIWILIFVLVVPWDDIETPITCIDIPTKDILGRIKGKTNLCNKDTTLKNIIIFATILWTLGMAFATVFITNKLLKKI